MTKKNDELLDGGAVTLAEYTAGDVNYEVLLTEDGKHIEKIKKAPDHSDYLVEVPDSKHIF